VGKMCTLMDSKFIHKYNAERTMKSEHRLSDDVPRNSRVSNSLTRRSFMVFHVVFSPSRHVGLHAICTIDWTISIGCFFQYFYIIFSSISQCHKQRTCCDNCYSFKTQTLHRTDIYMLGRSWPNLGVFNSGVFYSRDIPVCHGVDIPL